ncbi:cuscuta receptor 1 isoform X2 [Populus alba]|uniref:cuscuta receptor 1 isoform X2 n=1 Tax=Populus alba TaxID=43335 RepID=UPI003CC6DEC0
MGLNRFSSLAGTLMIYAMVLSQSWWSCHGCLDEERSALLRIHSSFNYSSGTFLQPWGKVADCCSWEGVDYNFTTGRVVELYLPGKREEGLGDLYLNVSLFRPFQELQHLDLRGNFIVGCVENEGFERLSGLDSLVFLDLGENKFDNSVLSSLGGLSSLKSLDIAYNQLKGSFNVTELDALINLERVNLAGNEIDKFVLSEDTRGFGNVSFISLSNSTSNGRALPFTLLESLMKFPYFRTLSLAKNNLEGSFGTTLDKDLASLASLKNLEELDLSLSTVDNSFLQTVRKITTLKSLRLNGCRLNGSIPKAQGGPSSHHQVKR